ncbi:hypothetical protein Tco_0181338, partial [Tanacetum coccineum]
AQLLHQEELTQVERRQRDRAAQEEASIAALYKREQFTIEERKKGKRIKRVADLTHKQKSSKKQKMMQEQESSKSDEDTTVDYKHEKEELRMWLTVVLDEEETMDL